MKKSPVGPLADQPKGRIKDELETIREEEEDDQKPQIRTLAERRTLREKEKRRGWEVGMKKIKNIVTHPLSNLEQKYVQLMTGFAGRVGSSRGTRMPVRARALPDWEL